MVLLMSDLVTQVRLACDILTDNHVSDAEILQYLNNSLSELYGIIVTSFEDYYVTSLTFSLTASDDGYTLPSDYFKTLRLDRSLDGSNTSANWFDVPRAHIRDEVAFNNAFYNISTGYLSTAYVEYGNKIKPLPQQTITGTYRLLYYPAWQDLAEDDPVTSVGPASQHWEKFAVADACFNVSVKNETDQAAAAFAQDREAQRARIQGEAANRNAGQLEPPSMSAMGWNTPGSSRWGW